MNFFSTQNSKSYFQRHNFLPFSPTLKLTVEEVEYYKDAVACLNHEPGMLPCNINHIEVTNCLEYLPCAIGIHFWNFWRLFDVFPNDIDNKDVLTHDIALILTILRLVRTCSKNSTIELYESTAAPQLNGYLVHVVLLLVITRRVIPYIGTLLQEILPMLKP